MKKLFFFLGRTFYWFWKLLTTGCLVFTNLIIIATVLLVLAFFIQPEVQVPDDSALVLALQGDIVEKPTAISPMSRLVNGFAGIPVPRETLLQDVLDVINAASEDDRIKLIVLSLTEMKNCSLNQLRTVGQALESFKQAGKKVIAIDDQYSQRQYFLASYADEIYLNPMGSLGLRGFGIFRLYLKDLIDNLAINFHIFRVGSYKSATEPFLRNDMSEDAKIANRLWLTNLWNLYCTEISSNRGLEPEFINTFINEMPQLLRQAGGNMSRMALAAKLVDGIKTRPEIDAYLSDIVGRSEDDKSFNNIHFTDYLEQVSTSFTGEQSSRNHIGLIVAQGNIMYGPKIPGQISSENLRGLIREARKDNKIKALVLRIDSGGGSALASEQIRQELLLLQQTGKPLVVSMGGMAASGGYWISASADRIIAAPSTLTGSIGIFGIIPTLEESITKIGVHSDGIATNRMAGAGNPTTPFPPEYGETIQLSVEEIYSRFLAIVSEGRKMPVENVKKIAKGRVWDGKTARELGLVDELGNLDDAVTAAAELAGLKNYSPLYIKEKDSSGDHILRQLGLETLSLLQRYSLVAFPVLPLLGAVDKHFDLTMFKNDPSGIYAHCLLPRPGAAF